MNDTQHGRLETATLGGGCFWCLEAVFQELEGVQSVTSGYSGGDVRNPDYKDVCTGDTGHAEVVQILYDPAVLSYADILEVFFSVHDPTTKNRQGADVGTQYRSVIFTRNDEEKRIAEAAIAALDESGVWSKPVVTQVLPLVQFYPAETYHQDYYQRNSQQGYCQVVISPKLEKFRKKFHDRLK
ncbi:MAG: peptide-methionine (S)-S-oxide reductase MsrA [Candidatus Latescibacteria bacterium]|nr:peptide-methionine (S)-S-oxide reductase MsrA [bacterium]MCB9514417.1 peptide-methionine (S)-S-oxide reductase MsrA [Candidatus Latescibacterota bacterium]MCB9516040.1 peptide-methionine (S)-S-oxide reductase MsrA [Candidatus Latescibacterota bacterium]